MAKMPNFGGGNMQNMMRQMQKMQKEMGAAQDQLNESEFVGKAPEDLVTVTFTGDHQMKDIQIKPEAIDADDPDMLQDLIVAAVNDAMKTIKEKTESTLGRFAKGM